MKPAGVKADMFIRYGVEHDDKDSKFKVDDHVRISKYKNILAKGYTPNWSEEGFVIKKVKKMYRGYVISGLNGEEFVAT